MQYFGLCGMSVIVVTFLFKGMDTVQITPLRRTLACASCLQCFDTVAWAPGRRLACKKWGDGGDGHWLVRMEWRPAGCSVCLPLLILPWTIKSRSSLLALVYPGGPGERAVKQLWWWWCGNISICPFPVFYLNWFEGSKGDQSVVCIIRLHCGTTYVDAAYCYQPSSVVCQVCLSITLVSPVKMAEAIEMPFALRTRVGPRNHVLDRDPHPPWGGAILKEEGVAHCKV